MNTPQSFSNPPPSSDPPEAQVGEIETALAAVKQQLADANDALKTSQAAAEKAVKTNEENLLKARELERLVTALQDEKTDKETKLTLVRMHSSNLAGKQEFTRELAQALASEKIFLGQQCALVREDERNLQAAHQGLNQKQNEVNAAGLLVDDSDVDSATLQGEICRMREELSKQAALSSLLVAQNSQLVTEKNEILKRMADQSDKHVELTEKLGDVNDKTAEIEKLNNELEEKLNKLEKEKKEEQSLEEQIELEKGEVEKLKTDVGDLKRRIDEQEEELTQKKQKIEQAEETIGQAKKENDDILKVVLEACGGAVPPENQLPPEELWAAVDEIMKR